MEKVESFGFIKQIWLSHVSRPPPHQKDMQLFLILPYLYLTFCHKSNLNINNQIFTPLSLCICIFFVAKRKSLLKMCTISYWILFGIFYLNMCGIKKSVPSWWEGMCRSKSPRSSNTCTKTVFVFGNILNHKIVVTICENIYIYREESTCKSLNIKQIKKIISVLLVSTKVSQINKFLLFRKSTLFVWVSFEIIILYSALFSSISG